MRNMAWLRSCDGYVFTRFTCDGFLICGNVNVIAWEVKSS